MMLLAVLMAILGPCSGMAEEFEVSGSFYVGEFENNSAEISAGMTEQILAGLTGVPLDQMLLVRLRAYCNSLGNIDDNRVLVVLRQKALEEELVNIRGQYIKIVQSRAYISENSGGVNKRFATVEFGFEAKEAAPSVESVEGNIQSMVELSDKLQNLIAKIESSAGVEEIDILKDLSFQFSEFEQKQGDLMSGQVALTSNITRLNNSVQSGLQNVDDMLNKSFVGLAAFVAAGFVLSALVFFVSAFVRSSRKKTRNNIQEARNADRHQELIDVISTATSSNKKLVLDDPFRNEIELTISFPMADYIVTCHHTRDANGQEWFVSPFKNLNEESFIRKRRAPLLEKSLRGCLKEDESNKFYDQKHSLVKEAKIKVNLGPGKKKTGSEMGEEK